MSTDVFGKLSHAAQNKSENQILYTSSVYEYYVNSS